MSKYEKLLDEADSDNINVYEYNLKTNKECGYYLDNNIVINSNITSTQKYCVLAEELGHHFTSCGDIRNLTKLENKKQENKARRWGYDKICGLDKIATAIKEGARNRYEIAEKLDVTDEYFDNAIQYLRLKYGCTAKCQGITFIFEPNFAILLDAPL